MTGNADPLCSGMTRVLLRSSLILVSVTGLFALFVLVMPWSDAVAVYERFGIDMPERIDSPYLEYLTYLGAAMSVVIGVLYLLAGIAPTKYAVIIPLLGWSLLFFGVVVLYHGLRLKLPPWPFYPDPVISFVFGTIILIAARKNRIREAGSAG